MKRLGSIALLGALVPASAQEQPLSPDHVVAAALGAHKAKDLARLRELEPSLDKLRALVRKGEVLVHFQDGLAFVVNSKATRIVALGTTTGINAAQKTFSNPATDPAAARKELHQALIAPLRLDSKTTRLLVSPGAEFSYVPFALLAGGPDVAYLPSLATYLLLRNEAKKRGKGVLALGDPDHEGFLRLPGAAKEAQAVGDVVLLRGQATEAALIEALAKRPRWRAVHLACHSLIKPKRPLLSSLALAPDPENDCFLTTLEIFRMKIPADLVVLGANETAKGKVYRAEGLIGFTRAFLFAGAPRVIVSLWKVDDEATKALMVKFYELWKPGKMETATALKQAPEFVRSHEKWKHPYYWAAWQLWGMP